MWKGTFLSECSSWKTSWEKGSLLRRSLERDAGQFSVYVCVSIDFNVNRDKYLGGGACSAFLHLSYIFYIFVFKLLSPLTFVSDFEKTKKNKGEEITVI